MRRGHDQIELGELGRIHIERPILENIRLDSFEDAELAAELLVQLVDLGVLRAHLVHLHAAGDRQPV